MKFSFKKLAGFSLLAAITCPTVGFGVGGYLAAAAAIAAGAGVLGAVALGVVGGLVGAVVTTVVGAGLALTAGLLGLTNYLLTDKKDNPAVLVAPNASTPAPAAVATAEAAKAFKAAADQVAAAERASAPAPEAPKL